MARSVTDAPPRRSTRNRNSSGSVNQASGSEYSAGNASGSGSGGPESDDKRMEMDDAEAETQEVQVIPYTTSRGRHTKVKSYNEESDGDLNLFNEDEDVEVVPRRRGTRGAARETIISDDEGEAGVGKRYPTRNRTKVQPSAPSRDHLRTPQHRRVTRRSTRLHPGSGEEDYVDDQDADADADGDTDELEDVAPSTPESPDSPPMERGEDNEPKKYSFRQRSKVNYAIPPPLEEVQPVKPPARSKGKPRGPGWSANGAELGRYMGLPQDDSDSDYPKRTPRKPFGAAAGGGIFAGAGGGMFPNDLAAAAGTPSNLGKVGDAALADADPLGVNTNVTFEEVGGLDDHITSLKEMTLLPLLYPEVFQQFTLTPPRGVLFHGPPGTGKTLLARALAASCRSNGKGISFFMRKGADCLSKWVGEAERQLRLLFEEARNSQPSIIFFDEIDGLAPVRSSKQDQIHASIVSTLLALMDGMDGRGQVIVIGATNRPDAIDPALRRPGRFDREFYFPLPNVDARVKILSIITKKWEGWQGEKAEDTIRGLAQTTKGYGGADLRALCTEAALNAVQRCYPQIYKSQERLLLQPENIRVQARDFMISVKKLVPSSARSSSATAAPLPSQLVPLLAGALEQAKAVLAKALPVGKKRNALEEAELEDEGEEGALEREIMLQSMETLRIYRPRVIFHGPSGMGQGFVGAAALHHLEGFHVQTLDIGHLLGDSTRTVEAAIVQLFVEAKRHQPSVIYIPSLTGWCAAVSDTARTTVKAMLDSLSPTDPILLLAVVDAPFASLLRDVRAWFGVIKENRVAFSSPDADKRRAFFKGLLEDIRRPPNQFPDGVKRRKRVLEVLPIAPPLKPRQPSEAELAVQAESDQKLLAILTYRLGPILTELKRKFKRFTKRAADEYNFGFEEPIPFPPVTATAPEGQAHAELPQVNGVIDVDGTAPPQINGQVNGIHFNAPPRPNLYEVDLERIHVDLYKGKYLTPHEFLEDVGKIVHNAGEMQHEDSDRFFKAQAMYNAAQVSIHEFDPQLRLECERMAVRERERRSKRREAKGKGKQTDQDNVFGNGTGNGNLAYAPGTRRSARNNGQQPEITITDPLLIERKNKRQRSNEAAGDSHGSSDENPGNRTPKRTRIELGGATPGGPDELDVMGPTSSQPRPNSVRFVEPLEPLPPFGCFVEQVTLNPNAAMPDLREEPRRPGGFDHLLNPLPNPNEIPQFSAPNGRFGSPSFHYVPASPTPSRPNATLPHAPEPTLAVPTLLHPGPSTDDIQMVIPPSSPAESTRHLPIPNPVFVLEEENATESEQQEQPDPDPPAVMEIDRPRSPTPPPPPPFTIDERLITELETRLVQETEDLSVEQLEQLRAMSLGCVWRHRQAWDRDDLVRELLGVATDFLAEVTVDDDDSESHQLLTKSSMEYQVSC